MKVRLLTAVVSILLAPAGDSVRVLADTAAAASKKASAGELSEWAGVYTTTTHWWGEHFVPLIIDADGTTVRLAGTRLDFTYKDNELAFDWQPIKGTRAKGRHIRFRTDATRRKVFDGRIYPRPQDGPVEFSGQQITDPKEAYLLARKSLMAELFDPYVTEDLLKKIGWDDTDRKAAARLEALKKEVIRQDKYYDHPWEATWFISVRHRIEATKLFTFLRRMPKGAILHVHPSSMGDYESLLEAAADYTRDGKRFYVSPRYRKHTPENELFVFAEKQPSGYIPLRDAWVKSRQKVLATLVLTKEDKDHDGDIWELFSPIFSRVAALLDPPELNVDYYRRAFEYLAHEDNVSHVELRTGWDPKHEDDPTRQEYLILKALKGIELSMKAIWSDSRDAGEDTSGITDDIVNVGRIMSDHPGGHLIGYDLVGEEDKGETTYFFLDNLIAAYCRLDHTLPPMFFHDGESDLPPDYASVVANRRDTPSQDGFNNNLVDAYLMNTLTLGDFTFETARVGHGLELFKTPALSRRFQEAGICVELCPISNQLLRYVPDIREHPGQAYLAGGIPVCLNPDDPAIYGYQGVTHDFWEACIAWDLDLLALKVLAYYSLEHSGLQKKEKAATIAKWRKAWTSFAHLEIDA